jgi:hypothetical protein
MSEEQAVIPESPPVEEVQESEVTEESVTPESQPEESVSEASQPQEDVERSEPSPDTEVDAIKQALAENAEPSETPVAEEPIKEDPPVEEEQPEPVAPEESELYAEPEGLRPKAQERFRALVDNNKQVTQELDTAKNAMAEIHKTVESSGMSPEEFGLMLSYAQMANSGQKDDHEYAFKMIETEYKRMAAKLGVEVEGVEQADLFADFPDIKEKVDGYELSKEDALEIVNARKKLQPQTQEQQPFSQSPPAPVNDAEEKAGAIEGVKNFMANMEKTDIDFKSKESVLLEQVEEIRKNYPVAQWPAIVKQLYSNIGRLGSKTKQAKKAGDSAPLKSTPNAGGAVAPQTALDAVKFALNQ